MLHRRAGALPVETPDVAQDGLQANAVFVHGPQFDLHLGKAVAASLRSERSVFERLRLLLIGLDMVWPMLAPLALQAHQAGPAQLHANRPSQLGAHPIGDEPPSPDVPLRRGSSHGGGQFLRLLLAERQRRAM